ncbi:MAG: TrkH family potassium uptake protein [Bacteroidales bacterium]|nr:TrkH family potassium uptake protein [Bacteroidales bacterium]
MIREMYKSLLKQFGGLMILLGIFMSLPMLVSLLYSEWYSAIGFFSSGLLALGLGFYLYKGFFKNAPDPKYKDALFISAFSWLFIAITGSLPILIIAYITPLDIMQQFVPEGMDYSSSLLIFRNPLHCFFESMSAFTTTGLTMAYHEPSVGKGILFYRSLAQWVGGAGFIVMSLAVLKQVPGQGSVLLYESESSGEKLKPNVTGTARAIWKLYLGITGFSFVYLFTGTFIILPDYPLTDVIFDSLNHAMTGQSTGGFSTLDDSIAGYNSHAMELLYLLPMILGALSIPFYYKIIYQKKFSMIRKDIQTRALLTAFIAGSIIMTFLLFIARIVQWPISEGVFQFISAMSTTGWQTSDISAWDDVSVVFIVIVMMIGGAAGATVGGIKIIRALLIYKGVRWQIRKVFLSDRTIKTVKFNGKLLLPEEMNRELARASTLAFIYLLFVLISTMITSYFLTGNYTLADAFFEAASAQGTVGLSTGITSPEMSPVIEIVYIIQMWAGRLEIFPVLIFINVLLGRTKPRII